MAEGGDVTFCSKEQAHDPGCQYFAGGGVAEAPNFDDLPEDTAPAGAAEPTAAEAPNFDDLKEDAPAADAISQDFDDLQDDDEKYSTPGQQELTKAESLAQGALGPLATLGERGLDALGVPGVSTQDIVGRQNANPVLAATYGAAGTGLSFLTGVGEAGLIAKGVSKLPQLEQLGAFANVTSSAMKGLLTQGLVQGGDEVSKALLGQGDPNDAVGSAIAHMGIAGLIGAVGGGIGKAVDISAEAKASQRINNWLAGAGKAIAGEEMGEGLPAPYNNAGFSSGYKFIKNKMNGLTSGFTGLGALEGGREGYHEDGVVGALKGAAAGAIAGFASGVLGNVAVGTGKYMAPALLRIVGSGPVQAPISALRYVEKVSRGAAMVDGSINALFKGVSQKAYNAETMSRLREKTRDWVSDGGTNQSLIEQQQAENQGPQPGFAEGGLVEEPSAPVNHEPPVQENDGVATHFPEQNIMLSAAKARVYGYLQSKQPAKNVAKLAFDEEPDDAEAKRSYDSAIDIANKPMTILHHIDQGTLEPEHLAHMQAMYPELTTHLQKKITERITKAQMKDEMPAYHVRQGLSMFMGTPLSGEMTPQSIIAAQATFAPKQAPPQQPPSKPKKGTAPLQKAAQSFMTADQARDARQNKD